MYVFTYVCGHVRYTYVCSLNYRYKRLRSKLFTEKKLKRKKAEGDGGAIN